MRVFEYNRNAAVAYAKEWAFGRNPKFYNFDQIGGDCTNFASQCLYAGGSVMNFTPVTGWFYRSLNDRAPAWTGVEYLYRFLTENQGVGPFAETVTLDRLELGDLIQFGRATGDFYHTPVVTGFHNGTILVAAHTYDAFNRPLTDYSYEQIRGIHILGIRK